jgi:NADP-dependent 3-hydroxy acid dehydrogenase YdfG
MSLALVDNNATNLASALKALPSSDKTKTETYQVDVSKVSEWHDLRTKVEKDFGGVDFLMLNAGIGLSWDSGKWEDSEYWTKTLETNLFGVSVD